MCLHNPRGPASLVRATPHYYSLTSARPTQDSNINITRISFATMDASKMQLQGLAGALAMETPSWLILRGYLPFRLIHIYIEEFARTYYQTFDTDRKQLARFYVRRIKGALWVIYVTNYASGLIPLSPLRMRHIQAKNEFSRRFRYVLTLCIKEVFFSGQV
jgi:hypothetical protein